MSEALHKAAQAALEALEHHVEQTRPIQKTRDAIVALRAALAQPPAPTAQPAADDRLRMALRADLAIESLAVDDLLRAMGEDPEQYRTEGGAVNRLRLLAWLKDRAAQPVQQPGAEPQPSGYESTTTCYTRWVSPERWAKFSPGVQKWYRPYWAPAQRQPLSDEQIDSLTFPFLTAELGPTAYDRAIARAIEAAHGITAAPAAQKGEKL